MAPQHAALEHLSLGVMLFDADWQVMYLNPMAEMLCAVSARHMVGQSLDGLIWLDQQRLSQLFQNVLQQGQAIRKQGAILTLADRTTITVDYFLNPLLDQQGGLLLELQQIDRQLQITRDNQLLNQQQASRDLVQGLAHEIKNPLGGLRGAAQLLAAELPTASLTDYTAIIIQEADRLQALVDRLLGPHERVPTQAVNIHQVLEHVRTLVLAGAEPSLLIERDYDPSIPAVQGVADQLIQVVLNIVTNAVHVLRGKGQITLRTRILRNFTLRQQRHRLVARIDIIDNGPGIAPDLADTLFLPMVTSGQGTGLGLSIAQTLIAQHQGLIECSSQPGTTVFSIRLPLQSAI